MTISTDFAPPFKLIVPYFILGALALLCSAVLMLFIDMETLHYLNPIVLAWVHLFLLGFVMMIICGAMAQLVPVVLEVGHFAVDFYYIIYPLLSIGTILMCIGFYQNPMLLTFGGIICFIAFCIFLCETFLTVLKVKKINFVISTVILSNSLFFMGIIFGVALALNYAGLLFIDVASFLKAHVYLVFIGFMGTIIVGMSLVLLPMFWLSHEFSTIYAKVSLVFLSIAIVAMVFQSLYINTFLEQTSYFFTFLALGAYLFQIFTIFRKRARVKKDIYYKNILFSYISLFVSFVLSIFYFITNLPNFLHASWWFALFGFITFLIMGHLYKIVPFLVWYEKFSLHVGKRKVPMLDDMVPKKTANLQFILQATGALFVGASILLASNFIFKYGVIAIIVGVLIFIKDILYMIYFKE